ncbi:MAG: GumC family protein [Acidobacteriota bacterium]|nr:GumC family protein [Acidobacteriota bacterium]
MRNLSNKNLVVQIWETVFRRKLLIASVFALVVSSGMIVTFLTTPKYEAEMSILVSRDRTDPRISAADKLPDIVQASISDEEFNSELELIKSREVIAGAVKDLDLINNQAPKNDTPLSNLRESVKKLLSGFWETSAKAAEMKNSLPEKTTATEFETEKAINRVSGNLDVTPIKKSRIIKVNYTDTDPLRAKRTLEKIYEKYIDLHVQINQKTEAGQVFKEQTQTFKGKLNAVSNTLKNFDTRNGVTGAEIGVQRELLLKQLYETQAQINASRTEIGENEKRIVALQEKIAAQPEQIQTGSVSKYVSALDRMKEELIQLEQQKTQFLQKYQPGSRFVRETEERIQQLKKTLAQETANPPQERSFALNDLRRRLESDLYNAQTSLAALREREKNLTSQADKLRKEVVLLNSRSIDRANLERERSINEEAYLLYQKKARENEISQALNKEQVMNFGIVDPPSTDGEPKSPKPLLNLLILMVVGAAAGFASAIVMDKLTATTDDYDLIASPALVEQRLELPVLAIISVIEPPPAKLVSKPKLPALPPFLNNKNGRD